MKNQNIKCTVYNCKHCNVDKNHCVLETIKVCDCNPKHEKEATMCDSYDSRDEK